MAFSRIDRLPAYVFNVTAELKLEARRRGEDIVDLSMGNPDGATPPHIVAKLCEVAQRDDTHGYSSSKGIPRLRRTITQWYQSRYDVEIDPETEAIVTIGSKEGLAHLMLATPGCWGYGTRAEPKLSDPYLWRGDRGRSSPLRSTCFRRGFFSLSWNGPFVNPFRRQR